MTARERKIISEMSRALDECDDKRFARLERELHDFRAWMGKRK